MHDILKAEVDCRKLSSPAQVLSEALLLIVACPHDKCNTPFCPFDKVRKMKREERIDWIRGLSDQELARLTNSCQICVRWMGGGTPA